jgi:WD repeat-containing protein 19
MPKFKKKIEGIARKPVKEEPKGNSTPCPFCGTHFNEYDLVCPGCYSNVPFCIASGK